MPELVLLLTPERELCEMIECPRFFRSDDCIDGQPCMRAWGELLNVKLAFEDAAGEPHFVGAIQRLPKK